MSESTKLADLDAEDIPTSREMDCPKCLGHGNIRAEVGTLYWSVECSKCAGKGKVRVSGEMQAVKP
jgi:DnaJ-class molecular chaperone